MTEQKAGPGRPRKLGATIPLQVRISPEQHEWIIAQPEGASEMVRKWIDEAMNGAAENETTQRLPRRPD